MTIDDPTLWKWVLDHVWLGLTALMTFVWRVLNGKIETVEKIGKERIDMLASDTKKRMDEIAAETTRNREISAKIFDKLDEMRRDSESRHERLIVAIHTGLAGKADK